MGRSSGDKKKIVLEKKPFFENDYDREVYLWQFAGKVLFI
jgi:hypothetical protein